MCIMEYKRIAKVYKKDIKGYEAQFETFAKVPNIIRETCLQDVICEAILNILFICIDQRIVFLQKINDSPSVYNVLRIYNGMQRTIKRRKTIDNAFFLLTSYIG